MLLSRLHGVGAYHYSAGMTQANLIPDAAATMQLVQVVQAAQTGQHAQVVALCDGLKHTGQETPFILYLRGVSLHYLGRSAEAVAALQAAVTAHPEPAWIEALGGVWQELGGLTQAYEAYDHYFERVRDDVPPDLHQRYSDAMKRTGSTPFPLSRRLRHVFLMQLLHEALARTDASGWVAECGCFMGHSTRQIAQTLHLHDATFDGASLVVCDSFEGLGQMMPQDTIPDDYPDAQRLRLMSTPGHFAAPFDRVRENLADFPVIRWVKGWIPQSLTALPDEARYRFVHVDVDTYEPTAGAFGYFWPKLLPGGMIVSDDYGWPGARTAIDTLVASLPQGSYRFSVNPYQQAWLEKC